MAALCPPAKVRRRAGKACIPCRTAKKRCIGRTPCAYCVNHRRTSSCRYTDDDGTAAGDIAAGTDAASILTHCNPPPHDPAYPSSNRASAAATPANYSAADSAAGHQILDLMSTQSPETTTISSIPPRLLRDPKGNEGQ